MLFIKACHQRGIAVIMDVVYNHYNHNALRAEWLYDADADEQNIYYWYEGKHIRLRSVGRRFRQSLHRVCPATTRRMFASSFTSKRRGGRLWEEFHIDGFPASGPDELDPSVQRTPCRRRRGFERERVRDQAAQGVICTLRMIRPGIMLIAEDHSDWDKAASRPTRMDSASMRPGMRTSTTTSSARTTKATTPS